MISNSHLLNLLKKKDLIDRIKHDAHRTEDTYEKYIPHIDDIRQPKRESDDDVCTQLSYVRNDINLPTKICIDKKQKKNLKKQKGETLVTNKSKGEIKVDGVQTIRLGGRLQLPIL